MRSRGGDDATVRHGHDAGTAEPAGDADAESTPARTTPRFPSTEPIACDPDDDPPLVLPDRFEPVGTLGRGGMGRVVRCLDRSLNREVAVKLIHHFDRDSARQRFLREARAIGTLRHPNIVTVHDVAPGGEYLVMELVEGESLASRIRRDGPLGAAEVHRIGAALLGALAAAHREGIVHRDVKPANILLDATGAVKLTDFGIASFGDSDLTQTGQPIGTPAYMSPEQLRGRRVGTRADIYGAGATLFEVATGKRLNDEIGRIDDPARAVLDATGDPGIAAAIAQAVEERDTDRFATAEAFATALAAPARPRRRLGRYAVAVTAIVAIGAGALGAARWSRHRAAPGAARATIAMLPFTDRVGDPRLDFAASGLPHLLGEQLGRIGRIDVLGYYRVRGQLTDPAAPTAAWRTAARALGADVVVRGELVPSGSTVRISVIVERGDGQPLDHLDREVSIDRVPETVKGLASAVASTALGAPLALEPGVSRDFQIERELQLGIAAFEGTEFAVARSHLEAVIARDDSLADAHYYLALLDWWQQLPPAHHIERALASTLEPTRRDFLVGLRMLVGLEYPGGITYFRDLARRVPDDRDVAYGLFEALFHGGHPGESMEVYHRLRALAPRFYVGLEHAVQYYAARGDAAQLRWVIEHAPPASQDRAILEAQALMAEQRYTEAVRTLERAAEEQPTTAVELTRMLVEAYAVSGQLALATEATSRLAETDPGYRAIAAFGLALARGQTGQAERTQARHAAALGIPGVKTWAARLDLLALDLPAGDPAVLHDHVNTVLTNRNVSVDVGAVALAAAVHDARTISAARHSTFPQVAAAADAAAAEERGDHAAAAAAWRRTVELNSDGRLQLFGWYAVAQDRRALGDHAGVIAACDEVITPRAFTWSWATTIGPCLRWSAEAATSLGRDADARQRWRRLLALRVDAPPEDELAAAARLAASAATTPTAPAQR